MVPVRIGIGFVATLTATMSVFAACGTFSGSSSEPGVSDSATAAATDATDAPTELDAGALSDSTANEATTASDASPITDASENLVQNASSMGGCTFWLSNTVGVTSSAALFDGSAACSLCANGGNAFAYQSVTIPVASGDTFKATTELEAPASAGFTIELGVDLYAKGFSIDTLNASTSPPVSGVAWVAVEDSYTASGSGDELRFTIAFDPTSPAGTCLLVADSTLVKTN